MAMSEHRYFILNKPCNMVSQFVSSDKVNLLGDLDFDFPEGTHAIGRLDNNSEGLLLLTTNKKVTRLLFHAEEKHSRTYLVQVNNILSNENLLRLQSGVTIRIKGAENYTTPACAVRLVDHPDTICHFKTGTSKEYGAHTWLLITLTEGKFRQVRKMMAAVRHRCKRLIRVSIEDITLDGLAPGMVYEMQEKAFFEKLKIKNW
jgi:23S rRNA pseudouridine2457 synthase